MTSVHEAAHLYLNAGLRVHPIRPGSKAPAINDWPTRSTSDPAQVDEWWGPNGTHRDCGIGIRTGEGLFVIDVDDVPAWERALPPTGRPITWYADTPSGGMHIWFRVPDGGDDPTNSTGDLPAGIDVRGEGGQVVAWPTPGYEWNVTPWTDAEHFHVDCQPCPTWLWDILTTQPTSHEQPAVRAVEPGGKWDVGFGAGRPGDQYNAEADARQILADTGWTHHHDGGGGSHWTRPGKQRREGVSATVWDNDGTTSIWSTTLGWPTTEPLRPFGLYAWARHGGDYRAAARDLRGQGYGLTEAPPSQLTGAELGRAALAARAHGLEPPLAVVDANAESDVLNPAHEAETSTCAETSTPDPGLELIDWTDFWSAEREPEQWAIYPLIPKGRGVSLYAPAKAGKSTVVLAAVAAAASGKPGLMGPAGPPTDVLYLDYEMTGDDLYERLEGLGYSADVDLTRLHYALIPSLPPLDTQAGAAAVVKAVAATGATVVVVDTYGRAVEGDENENDTTREFYRHTGTALKAMGVAVLRCDHAGKDIDKGARGGSAKNDDVDVVWRLLRTEGGVKLSRTHSRVPWVPESVELAYSEDDETGLVRLSPLNRKGYAAGTKETAEVLERLEVPVGVSTRRAQKALIEVGEGRRRQVVVDALRYLKEKSETIQYYPEPPPGTTFQKVGHPSKRDHSEPNAKDQVRGTEVVPEPLGTDKSGKMGVGTPPIGGTTPSPHPTEPIPTGFDAW